MTISSHLPASSGFDLPAGAFVDSIDPDATASTPRSTPSGTPIYLSWVVDAGENSSGLEIVEIFYLKDPETFWRTDRAAISTQASGSFEFIPLDGPGTYRFLARAIDNAGNSVGIQFVEETLTVVLESRFSTSLFVGASFAFWVCRRRRTKRKGEALAVAARRHLDMPDSVLLGIPDLGLGLTARKPECVHDW